ncbi:MAG: hypothetical protein JWO19_5835 [Bryobacterales bacterium]|nr:hypothetical protein [Bryobacterales bacterium]
MHLRLTQASTRIDSKAARGLVFAENTLDSNEILGRYLNSVNTAVNRTSEVRVVPDSQPGLEFTSPVNRCAPRERFQGDTPPSVG